MLGKRVDYSGRSVIVVGPQLKLHQCGLPKKMALELFRPFIYQKLELWGHAATIKIAKNLVEQQAPIVWDALDDVIKEHPVMLNRAPTLHRLSVQAFEPVLVEDKAIQLHPLVCPAFNADFDGDQMAVHVPLSVEAQTECRTLIMSTNNILSPAHGKPIILPSQDIVLGIYYISREVPGVKGEGKIFSSIEELRSAFDLGNVHIHAKIKININGNVESTTVGRALIFEVMPDEVPFELVNRLMTKKAIEELIDSTFRISGGKSTVLLADRLRTLGFQHSTTSGISVSIADMIIPDEKNQLIQKAEDEVNNIKDQYLQGLITEGERYNKVIDVWARTGDEIANFLMDRISASESSNNEKSDVSPSSNPIFMMVESGARGSQSQVRQLAGMRGLMAKPSGEIIETPITSNFREGLSVLQYFISTHGARKGLADTALKTANAGYLTRRLVDVAQDVMVTEYDCGTNEGVELTQLIEGGEVVSSVGTRALGRIVAEDVVDPLSGEKILSRNQEVDETAAKRIDDLPGSPKIKIRSVLTCECEVGVCALCYGRNLASGELVNIGEAVGIIAAQSIGEPGTQLTMRTFHIGGVAKVEQSRHEAKNNGKIKFIDLNYVKSGDFNICTSKTAEIVIEDSSTSLELERYPLTIGAKIYLNENDSIKKGSIIAEWDPTIFPFVAEESGHVEYKDLEANVTYKETVDPYTGLSNKEVIQFKNQKLNPALILVTKSGDRFEYPMPGGAEIRKDDGEKVEPGEFIASLPQTKAQTKDITGGLPRVAELFEARPPKDPAIVSEIEGIVSFGKDIKAKKRIIVTPSVGDPKEYLVPKSKHILVREGENITAGDQIVDGAPDPHDILKIKGEKELSKYIVDEIQDVYRLQGVRINDKHIEIITRQMLKRVKITDSGDTTLLIGEAVEKSEFIKTNKQILTEGGQPAKAEPLLLGITRASLSTKSWLSAASFQETTKVLTDASCEGKIDELSGLKENVIMGRLIPAGTGLPLYSDTDVEINAPEIEVPEAPITDNI